MNKINIFINQVLLTDVAYYMYCYCWRNVWLEQWKPVMAMTLSLLRDFVLVVPLLIILANKFGVVAVLYSAPIANVITMIVVVVIAVKVMKELSQKECC